MSNEDTKTKLLDSITPLLLKKGPKNLTMDYVAKVLGMSKRTLYEQYGSKENLVVEILSNIKNIHSCKVIERINSFDNAMEKIAYALLVHLRFMKEANVDFFRDMDEHYPQLRKYFEKTSNESFEHLQSTFEEGVKQGVFRSDVNYTVIARLFRIQMESLKRMEQLFPPEVTLGEAYQSIIKSLLRGIATVKGLEYFDAMSERFNKSLGESEN